MRFLNKYVVITGATGGLGRLLATAFASEGAHLYLFARDTEKGRALITSLEQVKAQPWQEVVIHTIDAAAEDLEERISASIKSIKKIDVLINNSATHGPIGRLVDNDLPSWRQAFQVNFYFPLILSKYTLQKMIPENEGKIINISGGGATSSRPNFSSYAIAKTALVRLTEILADEVMESNIQVNAMAPGVMATDLLKEVLQFTSEQVGIKELEGAKSAFDKNEPATQAVDLCLYLASKQADGITGRLISAKWDNWEKLSEKEGLLKDSDIFKLRRIVPEDRNKKW